jgi:hypothetical protein
MPILHKAVKNGIADNLLRWRKHVEQRCSSFMQATTMQLLGMRQSREGFSKDKDKKKMLDRAHRVVGWGTRMEKMFSTLGSALPRSTSSAAAFVMVLFKSQHLSAAAH